MKLPSPKALYTPEKRPYVDEKTLQVQFFESLTSDVKPLDTLPPDALEFEFLSLIDIGKRLEKAFYDLVDISKK